MCQEQKAASYIPMHIFIKSSQKKGHKEFPSNYKRELK